MLARIATAVLCALMLLPLHARAADGDAVLGVWSTKDGDAHFEIYKCGAQYCGKISWLCQPNYSKNKQGLAGLPKTDRKNPDPALRKRPLVDMPFMEGFRYAGDNRWEDGRIYNPEDGQKYGCELWLDGQNRLKVRGYLGIPLLGSTETWVRVGK